MKRILLKSGDLVTERELRPDESHFDGEIPVVGDELTITCRGRTFRARVIWGHWPGRAHPPEQVVALRVEEI